MLLQKMENLVIFVLFDEAGPGLILHKARWVQPDRICHNHLSQDFTRPSTLSDTQLKHSSPNTTIVFIKLPSPGRLPFKALDAHPSL